VVQEDAGYFDRFRFGQSGEPRLTAVSVQERVGDGFERSAVGAKPMFGCRPDLFGRLRQEDAQSSGVQTLVACGAGLA
jgi:hypothetical protein